MKQDHASGAEHGHCQVLSASGCRQPLHRGLPSHTHAGLQADSQARPGHQSDLHRSVAYRHKQNPHTHTHTQPIPTVNTPTYTAPHKTPRADTAHPSTRLAALLHAPRVLQRAPPLLQQLHVPGHVKAGAVDVQLLACAVHAVAHHVDQVQAKGTAEGHTVGGVGLAARQHDARFVDVVGGNIVGVHKALVAPPEGT